MKKTLFLALLLTIIGSPVALAGLQLGATRVIYPEQDKSTSVSVINGSGDKPYLVQAMVNTPGFTESHAFTVLPPLFRLERGGSHELRIIKSGDDLPKDRESLNWLTVRGVATSEGLSDSQANGTAAAADVSLGVGLNIKLLWRPSGLTMSWRDGMKGLQISRTTKGLKLTNSSPYYMSFSSLEVGGKTVIGRGSRISDVTLAPFSNQEISTEAMAPAAKATWRVINDYGASETFTGTVL
ncbi:MAG: molecular chaperone [Enterobacter ludwigii]|nr:molecular chaperone [Enterobacter ludwigii]